VPFGGFVDTAPHVGGEIAKNPNLGAKTGIFKPNVQNIQKKFNITETTVSIPLHFMLVSTPVIPKLWPVGHFWPAASYKTARKDLWSRVFYLHHISI